MASIRLKIDMTQIVTKSNLWQISSIRDRLLSLYSNSNSEEEDDEVFEVANKPWLEFLSTICFTTDFAISNDIVPTTLGFRLYVK